MGGIELAQEVKVKRYGKFVLLVTLLLWVGMGSFFAARALRDEFGAEADQPTPQAQPLPTISGSGPIAPPQEPFDEEARKPRFRGEILGIYFEPGNEPIPEKYVTVDELCPGSDDYRVPEDQAGELALHVELPPPFKLNPESPNTGIWACNDQVIVANWEYDVMQPDGYPGRLLISRHKSCYVTVSVALDRVKETAVGGRPAVMVDPITPDGRHSQAIVIFPEPFGCTEVWGLSIPRADLINAAEIVADATS